MYVDREDTKPQRYVLWCSFYILNSFISNCIMTAHVCRQGGYKAITVRIMMFFLYIELFYIQLYHGSPCMSTGRIQSHNGKYYDVLIYWTTLHPTVSCQLMYMYVAERIQNRNGKYWVKSKWIWRENATITEHRERPTHGTPRKRQITITTTRQKEHNLSARWM